MNAKNTIIWFRNDLRIHDHEGLHKALDRDADVIPLYCIDPRHFETTSFGFPKTGSHRAQFLLESLHDLRASLRAIGSELIVREGKPEEIIPALAAKHQVTTIIYQKEVTKEEVAVEKALEQKLFKEGIEMAAYWGSTLYHKNDLPMPIQSLPEIFTQFRKQVEKNADIRDIFPTPETLYTLHDVDPGEIPYLSSLGLSVPTDDERSVIHFKGGETAAKERLKTYFWDEDRLKVYKETRNGLLGANYSSKFSAWLSLGCISPRYIHAEVKAYENNRKKNSSTYWMIFELIWRDYFRMVAKKHGDTLFLEGGLKGEVKEWDQNQERFTAWAEGKTGVPFIDANMRELNATGFMSNRGRQNVASFLVHDLHLDWRMGAEYFESVLIDYDVCSNYGNWNYVAGIGNDPRENRYFNVITQGKRYDAKGEYIRTWVPELAHIPSSDIHTPYELHAHQLRNYHVSLGSDYPYPIVKFAKSNKKVLS